MWTYEYDNDTGSGDDAYWEFYKLMRDGEQVGQVSEESDAKAICEAMNEKEAK